MSEREQITLTYCGRRLGKADKLIYEFEYAGRSLVFAKMTHGVVGGRYTVDADVADDGGVSIYPATLTYTGEKIDDVDQVAVWEAVDRDTYATHRLKAAERKHARSSELDIALEPLARLIAKAGTRAEAQAIMRVVTAKLDDAWWHQR